VAIDSVWLGDFDIAERLTTELEQTGVMLGQPLVLAFVAFIRGLLTHYRGDLQSAQDLLTESLGQMRRLNRVSAQVDAMRELARVSLAAGRTGDAATWARQVIDLGRRNVVPQEIVAGHIVLARVACHRSAISEAQHAATEALGLAVEIDDVKALAWVFACVGQIARALDDVPNSAILLAGSEALRARIGFVHPAPRERELEHEYAEARTVLGSEAFNAAWKRGASLGVDELVQKARRVLNVRASTP